MNCATTKELERTCRGRNGERDEPILHSVGLLLHNSKWITVNDEVEMEKMLMCCISICSYVNYKLSLYIQ